jgi:hypothetical protein
LYKRLVGSSLRSVANQLFLSSSQQVRWYSLPLGTAVHELLGLAVGLRPSLQGYWLNDAVCESNVMVGLARSNQTVNKAGAATGPITHGGGMKLVVRNNTVLW